MGDIGNSGAISAGRTAIAVHGLSTFAGGIVNSGALTSTNVGGIIVGVVDTFAGSISNGGTITSLREGIRVSAVGLFGSSSAAGIVNSGTITVSGLNSGILATSIAELFGGISNAGTISARVGINTQTVRTFAGGIANSGSISAASDGIFVGHITTFLGGISNGGAITAGATGIGVDNQPQAIFAGGITNSGSVRANASGIRFLNATTFSGGISNAGTVSAGQNGIWAAAIGAGSFGSQTMATFGGGLANSGTISAGGNGILLDASAGGAIAVTISAFSGGISNGGVITASGNAIQVAATATGTAVATISTFAGGISNSGTISAGSDAISVTVSTTGSAAVAAISTFSGGITNSGTITAARAGIKVSSTTFPKTFSLFVGDISNGGAISAGRTAIAVQGLSTFAGGIVNGGALTSTNAAGIVVGAVDTFAGSISNGGTITSLREGIRVTAVGLFGSSSAGGIVNSGTITLSGLNSGILAASIAELFGGISNSGTISARVGINTQTVRTFAGGIANSGSISAASDGIFVGHVTTFLGGISNGGTITAGANGIDVQNLAQSIFADGITNSGSVRANASGILFLNASSFSGGISNAGTLSAGQNGIWAAAIASGSSGSQTMATFGGGIANSGTISAGGNGIWFNANAGGGVTVTVSAFSGGISNGGVITAGGNAIRVAATATGTAVATISTFAGGITNSGTISAGSAAIWIGSNAGAGATATIATFIGNVSNSGTIVGQTGIVVGPGISTFAGVIANSGTITGLGGTAINLAAAPNNMSIAISGGAINGNMVGGGLASGDSIHFSLGSGSFVYAAPYGFSGFQSVTVESGTVLLNGTNVAATADVFGGTLGGTGTLTAAVAIHPGGAFAPGIPGAPGTAMTIAGNLAFQPGAAYAIYLNPTTSTSANVTGTATLAGTVNANFAPGTYQNKQSYDILHSAGLNGTTFNGLITSGLFNFNASLTYTTTDVLLTLAASLGAGTPLGQNQQNVANAINQVVNAGAAVPPGFNNLFNLSGANLARALTALDGENATGAERGAFGLMTQFLQLMLYPNVDGRGDGGGGPIGFAADQPASLPPEIARAYAGVLKAPPHASFEQRWSAWGTAFGGTNRANGDPVVGSTTATASSYGVAAGLDFRATPDTLLGFALGGGGTNWALTQGLGTGRSDALLAGIYGATRFGPAYLAGSIGYADHWFTTNRTGLAADQLTANFNGQSAGARLETGYRIPLTSGHVVVGVTPYAAAQAQWFHTPTYRESDLTAGGFGLSYDAASAHDTRGELGARFDALAAVAGMPLIPRGRAAWAHDWVSNPAFTAVFQALPGAAFTINGAPIARNSALTSASAELRLSPGWGFGAKFDGEFASGAQTYAGTGTLRYSW